MRLFLRRDHYNRFWSCLLYVPRDRYNTEVRHRIEAIIREAFAGTDVESQVQLSESVLARVHLIVRTPEGARAGDAATVERRIAAAVLTWKDALRAALTARYDEAEALRLLARYGAALPGAYTEDTPASAAVADIDVLESLVRAPDGLHLRLYRPPGAGAGARVNLKLYCAREPRAISDVLPTLENLGLKLISERPYEVKLGPAGTIWVQDFELEHRHAPALDLAADGARLTAAITALWQGRAENDGFNRLVLGARLSWRETMVLRAYCRWLLQTGIPFSQPYMESVLSSNARTAERLARLFVASFDPALAPARRSAQVKRLQREIDADLARVARLDEDRILRAFRAAIDATLRTNYFQAARDGDGPKPYLSIKLDPSTRAGTARAAADVRDLGVRAARRGRAPAQGPRRARRAALVGPLRGLPHRGSRADEGAERQEHGDRAGRRQGRLRRAGGCRRRREDAAARGRRAATRTSSAACSTSPTTSSTARSCRRR